MYNPAAAAAAALNWIPDEKSLNNYPTVRASPLSCVVIRLADFALRPRPDDPAEKPQLGGRAARLPTFFFTFLGCEKLVGRGFVLTINASRVAIGTPSSGHMFHNQYAIYI